MNVTICLTPIIFFLCCCDSNTHNNGDGPRRSDKVEDQTEINIGTNNRGGAEVENDQKQHLNSEKINPDLSVTSLTWETVEEILSGGQILTTSTANKIEKFLLLEENYSNRKFLKKLSKDVDLSNPMLTDAIRLRLIDADDDPVEKFRKGLRFLEHDKVISAFVKKTFQDIHPSRIEEAMMEIDVASVDRMGESLKVKAIFSLFQSKQIGADDLDELIPVVTALKPTYKVRAIGGLKVKIQELIESGDVDPVDAKLYLELLK